MLKYLLGAFGLVAVMLSMGTGAQAQSQSLFRPIAVVNDSAVTGYDLTVPYFGRESAFIPTTGRIRRAIEETIDF